MRARTMHFRNGTSCRKPLVTQADLAECPKIRNETAPDDRKRDAFAMTREELIAHASPPCHQCGAPVQRVEARWHLDEDYRWRPGPYFMVCGADHRVLVEPLM